MRAISPHPQRISLMAAGELRDAFTALERGDRGTAVASLMAIDADSWQAIEQRLVTLGGNVADLIRALDTSADSAKEN
ncbi:hypothetical protein [Streptomyces reniochalinae]|uniref:Uncharacterized protein n=1 Tax=Streptomyces reniochalinae TaxID=2250578 RepID=A0A367EH10_9ACTN|nr:hypothetical protein [Streptomyces reniochalinae]RCG16925.1 hypothetical protein DQ392_17715 [Streptomyces reniochalinae]